MADQIERLIEAVNEVRNYITRLSTYSHQILLGRASTAVSSAVSAALGIIKITKQLAGTCAATASLTGAMIVAYFVQGAAPVAGISSATGSLNTQPQLLGSVAAVSNVANTILSPIGLAGSVSAQSGASSPLLNSVQLAGAVSDTTIVGHADLSI